MASELSPYADPCCSDTVMDDGAGVNQYSSVKSPVRVLTFSSDLHVGHCKKRREKQPVVQTYPLGKGPHFVQMPASCFKMPTELEGLKTGKFVLPPQQKIERRVHDNYIDLVFISAGGFGRVFSALNAVSQRKVALKVVSKQKKYASYWASGERECFLKVNESRFFIKLYSCFQTPSFLIYEMEYIDGGSLGPLIRNDGNSLTNDYIQFVMAELVAAVGFLHRNRIVHRDIKPDNIMLTREGHIKLADYGLVKVFAVGERMVFNTSCGTRGYEAPEMLEERSRYSYTVDWFSVGATMFEMKFFRRPYISTSKFKNWRPSLDQSFEKLRDADADMTLPLFYAPLALRLMMLDPWQRLGSCGAREVKRHPYFGYIDWAGIERGTISPPMVPNASNYRQMTREILIDEDMLVEDSDCDVQKIDQAAFCGFDITI